MSGTVDCWNITGVRGDGHGRLPLRPLCLDPHRYPALLHMNALCQRRGEARSGNLFWTRARRPAGRGVELDERHG